MHRALPRQLALVGLIGLGGLWAVLAWGQSAAQVPAEVPQTQPAALTSQPAPDDLTQTAARERLVSGLVGSKHDFTHGGRAGRNLCLPCHTPHLLAAPTPLYDRRQNQRQPLRTFQGFDVQLSGWTLLCLGCHDGVTAPDVYSTAHAINIVGQLGNSRLGTRGLRSHPIGIAYPVNAEGYHPAAAVEAAGLPLPEGRIQCTSCHDAHNTNRIPGMLILSNDRSRLCLTCHRI